MEPELERLSADQANLAARLAGGATSKLSGKVAAMLKRKAELNAAIAAAEQPWLAAAEAPEQPRSEPG